MFAIKKLFNGKAALQSVNVDDILFPISDEQRNELQNVIYGIYVDILSVSLEAGITPFLVGGSALGAVRHQGFIPWDDDLDIGFFRSDYERFLTLFEEKFGNQYCVNAPGKTEKTRARFTKILKKGTLLREMISIPEDEYNGIYVDVFPIDNVPNNIIQRRIKGIYSDILAYISSQVFFREYKTCEAVEIFKRTGKLNYYFRIVVGYAFSFRESSKWFSKFDKATQYDNDDSEYCTIAAGRKHYFGEQLRRDTIVPPKQTSFVDGNAFVFGKVEDYLSRMYGDYMKIPESGDREKHYIKELRLHTDNQGNQ